MIGLFLRRVFAILIMFALAFSLAACFGETNETSKKTDQGSEKTVDDGKWKVPTGADPQY